jgi:hypothetical protein
LPLSHEEIADIEQDAIPDWDGLLSAVLKVPVGTANATNYENRVEALITALFYPPLTNPTKQDRINNGRKRIDITYANMGVRGFFKWLQGNYPSAMIAVECKNYGNEVGNPELDQLIGRFSPSRGKVGLLICRTIEDPLTLTARCRDAANADQGYILALSDNDLSALVQARKNQPDPLAFDLLRRKFRELIM